MTFKNTFLLLLLLGVSCRNSSKVIETNGLETHNEATKQNIKNNTTLVISAQQTKAYLPLLKDKNVALVANQTSVIFKTKDSEELDYTHLVDSLTRLNVNLKKVFAPEHGFRGKADAGETVKNGVDTKTGIPIISLYGKNKKPTPEQLKDIDVVVFDIQDVGARFYTYISTLHYVMEACAEKGITLIVFDRPNPNGHYIDGPVLELEHKSFVGMHPVPVVYGLTIGEYAQMINGETWLNNGVKCDLNIIKMKNYSRYQNYDLPIQPSPNLPNATAINLYPSLCFFEGTNVSVGRGTNKQFQVVGVPNVVLRKFNFEFTPQPNEGAKYPKYQGKICRGYDLSTHERLNKIDLNWLIQFYNINKFNEKEEPFFNPFFTKLAGTTDLKKKIEEGLNAETIRASWQENIKAYQKMRKSYLIYDE